MTGLQPRGNHELSGTCTKFAVQRIKSRRARRKTDLHFRSPSAHELLKFADGKHAMVMLMFFVVALFAATLGSGRGTGLDADFSYLSMVIAGIALIVLIVFSRDGLSGGGR